MALAPQFYAFNHKSETFLEFLLWYGVQRRIFTRSVKNLDL